MITAIITTIAAITIIPILTGLGLAAALVMMPRRRDVSISTSIQPQNGLLFHNIDEKSKMRLSLSGISKNKFGEALDGLKNSNITMITVSQHTASSPIPPSSPAPESTQASPAPPPKRTAITFDDGLTAFYDLAYPLLKERGIKATVFPVAALVGKTGGWDVMGKTIHMTAAMLREIAEGGHEVGSHSLTHANLVWLDDRELIRELRDSKMMLEDITGTAVKSLSFPFGSWDKRVWEAAKSVGYEYATAYRGHRYAPPEMLRVFGVYRFDSAGDIIKRAVLSYKSYESTVSMAPNVSVSIKPSPQPLLSPQQPPSLPHPPLSLPALSAAAGEAIAMIMPHFSKGTPMAMFRREYQLLPLREPQGPNRAERSRS